jgi:hypothetical protein
MIGNLLTVRDLERLAVLLTADDLGWLTSKSRLREMEREFSIFGLWTLRAAVEIEGEWYVTMLAEHTRPHSAALFADDRRPSAQASFRFVDELSPAVQGGERFRVIQQAARALGGSPRPPSPLMLPELRGLTEGELWVLSGILFDRRDALGGTDELVGTWVQDIALFAAGYAGALCEQDGRRGPWGGTIFDIEQPLSLECYLRSWAAFQEESDAIDTTLGL